MLGIERSGGEYLGAPRGHTKILPGDIVILYGPREILDNLDRRRAGYTGNWDHIKAVDKQMQAQREQKQVEKETEESSSERSE